MHSLNTILNRSTKFLTDQGVPSARYEAELLMAHCLGISRLDLYLQFDKPLQEPELQQLRPLLKRRGNREPMAWILGQCGFYEEDFIVHPGVLCPRPDTETLVDAVLDLIPENDDAFFLADIGCGSGCIGLSIAKKRKQVRLFAVDISPAAIECTKLNTIELELTDRVAILNGAYLEPIPTNRPIDIIVSNPPYIPSEDVDQCEPEVSQHEPRTALDGGPEGYDVYNKLIPEAAKRARIAVAVEVGIHQAEVVKSIMNASGLKDISIYKDLGGIDRVVVGLV